MRTAIVGSVLLLPLTGCSGGDRAATTTPYHHTVAYSVLTTDPNIQQLSVIYTDESGNTQSADTPMSIWNQSVAFDRPVPTVVLTGSAAHGLGGVECIIQFDGKTVSQRTGQGVASCHFNLPTR